MQIQFRHPTTLSILFVSLSLLTTGQSASAASSHSSQHARMNPIVITPLRYASSADQSLSSVSVVTRKDIERDQPRDVIDALGNLPGINITRSGGYGTLASVYLRGTNPEHVLVLVDGVRVGSVANGQAAWASIPIDQVQRIEVVRGPRSSLYGADAIGGVIQIFTRQGHWNTLEGGASISGGSYGTGTGNAWFGWGNDRTKGSINAGLYHTDGINAHQNSESDHDGYENRNFSLSLTHRFRQSDQLSLNYYRSQGYNQFDPPPTAPGAVDLDHFIQEVMSAKYHLAVTTRDTLRLKIARSRIQVINRREDHTGTPSRFNNERPSISLINRYDFGRTSWLGGADYRDDRLSSSTAYAENSRYNAGVFSEITTHYFGIDFQISGRFDHNQAYGDHTTGQIGLGYDMTQNYRVEASYGNAFHAPSFNFLYYPGYANPNLEPERSRSAELDFLGRYDWGGWRLNLYQTKIRDLISSPPPNYIPSNVDMARIRGVELMTHARIGDTTLKASAGYMQPINRTVGHDLQRRTRFTGSLSVDQRFGPVSIGADLSAKGPRYNDPGNTTRLGGFGLLGLHATYHVNPQWRIVATGNNLLDKNHRTIAGYNSPGRTGYVKLIWQFSKEH